MNRTDVYELVTNRIIEQLEKGVVAWQKPFLDSKAVNWVTQKAYRGINTLLLEEGEYATFKQIKEAGGKVKAGAKGSIVVFWKFLEKENEDGETVKFPLLKYYNVFEINTQVEGLKSKRQPRNFTNKPIEEAQKVIDNFINKPRIKYSPGGAYYVPSYDFINMPHMKDFISSEQFYSTFFHELVHSTGHKDRLNREGIKDVVTFGSEVYSKEELVAEMGASLLCGVVGIDTDKIYQNSAAYLQSWLNALKNDKKLLITAAGQAQKAVDYILGVKYDD